MALSKAEIRKKISPTESSDTGETQLVNMAEDVKRFRHLRSSDDFKPQPISFTENHY